MNTVRTAVVDDEIAQELCERLADVFRDGAANDALTDDVFLDGHPPFWRFQLEGRSAIDSWIRTLAPDGSDVRVVRTVPTATGFVTEFAGQHQEDGEVRTDRKILLCEVRDGQVSELTVFCSGDWDAQLRARHATETTLLRP